jgi:hypothetical protein
MANNRLKTLKEKKIGRTAANIIERENCNTSAGIPHAIVKSMRIHSKHAHHKTKRTSRLHRLD